MTLRSCATLAQLLRGKIVQIVLLQWKSIHSTIGAFVVKNDHEATWIGPFRRIVRHCCPFRSIFGPFLTAVVSFLAVWSAGWIKMVWLFMDPSWLWELYPPQPRLGKTFYHSVKKNNSKSMVIPPKVISQNEGVHRKKIRIRFLIF